MDSKKRAELFLKRIEDGSIKKRYLTNHGFDYTNGPEKIASEQFNQYLGSCGYCLMVHRIGTEARFYHG